MPCDSTPPASYCDCYYYYHALPHCYPRTSKSCYLSDSIVHRLLLVLALTTLWPDSTSFFFSFLIFDLVLSLFSSLLFAFCFHSPSFSFSLSSSPKGASSTSRLRGLVCQSSIRVSLFRIPPLVVRPVVPFHSHASNTSVFRSRYLLFRRYFRFGNSIRGKNRKLNINIKENTKKGKKKERKAWTIGFIPSFYFPTSSLVQFVTTSDFPPDFSVSPTLFSVSAGLDRIASTLVPG